MRECPLAAWFFSALLILFGRSAYAVDPQLVSEIERLREIHWELVVSPGWQSWHSSRQIEHNQREVETIRLSVHVLRRLFGDVDALDDLGVLPRSQSVQVTLIEQRRALKKQFDRLDVFLRRSEPHYDPRWRETPIGREILALSVSLMNVQRHDRGDAGVYKLLQTKWIPEARTIARLAPYAHLDELLGAACEHLESRGLAQAIADVLLMLRKIEAQLDRGWMNCGAQLDRAPVQIEFEDRSRDRSR